MSAQGKYLAWYTNKHGHKIEHRCSTARCAQKLAGKGTNGGWKEVGRLAPMQDVHPADMMDIHRELGLIGFNSMGAPTRRPGKRKHGAKTAVWQRPARPDFSRRPPSKRANPRRRR